MSVQPKIANYGIQKEVGRYDLKATENTVNISKSILKRQGL